MLKRTISSTHRYSNRFLRSTDLVRDFNDPDGLKGYALTDFGRNCLNRISEGLTPNSGRRAWRLTGDFGSGKSSFALLLANAMRDVRRLPKDIFQQVIEEMPGAKNLQHIPILVVGNREAIAPAILRSLYGVLNELFLRRTKSSLELEIEKALSRKIRVSDKEVLDFIQEANLKIIQSGKGSGLLLILDEVGKFLEFAAMNQDQQDIYFLQQLAEMAARSKKQPLMVVCLLHQGFNAYAEQLAESTQREWEKVAGRFEEILFQQPLDQIALLIASALNVELQKVPEPLKKQAEESLNQAIQLGWFGTSASRETLKRIQHRLFPLDLMLLPVLVRTFQRFGQNERSLFSFLYSYEPFGLRAFSNSPLTDNIQPYRLADFYDYIRTNFGHRLAVASYRTHWNVIESIIEAYNTKDPQELRILKTIGVLNLLNTPDLLPVQDAVCWAVGGDLSVERRRATGILKKLERNRVLHFRGETRGYSLWPYTSVDIDSRLEEAKRAIPKLPQVAQAIMQQLDNRPIVARAHYIQTGNLRYFDIVYCKPDELAGKSASYLTRADGVIFIPLCHTEPEHRAAKAAALQLEHRTDLILLVALPQPLNHLSQAALDAQRWEWVQENTPELNNDSFAREEVELHLQEARSRLQTQIQDSIGLNRVAGRSTLIWFYKGQSQVLGSGRQALSWLSQLCNEAFDKAPKIKNELVNRHYLSPAATTARIRLVDLIFTHSDKPNLGIPDDRKPPERSMYLSVLHATGMHQEQKGRWRVCFPSSHDVSNILPTLEKIQEIISKQPDKRVPIQEIITTLRKPPYGLRDGLFPILLAVLSVVKEQEIAFYENGTFLREVGRDAFLRMTKAPQVFDIQYCKIEGIRSELFQRLIRVLELSPDKTKKVELLDVVRKLCQFVAQLPEYARNTKRLSAVALAVREIVLQAHEPVRMVFHDLPFACGFQQFEVGKPVGSEAAQRFALKLKEALDELRTAFTNLQRRLGTSLSKEFGYNDQAANQYRKRLAQRSEQLLLQINENKLRAFAFRLLDTGLSEADWLESMGSVLALRPPTKWRDEDEDTFDRELANLGGRFKRAESVGFTSFANGKRKTTGLRVAVTRADGSERQEIIHFEDEDEKNLKRLKDQMAELINKNKRLGMAAASQAIWSHLQPVEDSV